MALPKHLTADRLLRFAMTSIQKTPKLLECTPQSLLACVMTCAQLGLEPDQFLGQAYLVPFRDNRKGITICTLIPGYRGYIALARRSGEMQTVGAQVVYENDEFDMQYGIEDKLMHKPNLNGDRGQAIGAYCVFKYKDGGYSFDFLPTSEIEKIRKRSKAADDGPWVTDWGEMAKKTVIKRHAKLAPLSVEFQTAVALEDRAMAGESQADLLGMDDSNVIDAEDTPDFASTIPAGTDMVILDDFISQTAKSQNVTAEQVKDAAAKDGAGFWKAFGAWVKQEAKKKEREAAKQPLPAEGVYCPSECPDKPGTMYSKAHCDTCKTRQGCPAWELAV
jgi:recombination protein RecT